MLHFGGKRHVSKNVHNNYIKKCTFARKFPVLLLTCSKKCLNCHKLKTCSPIQLWDQQSLIFTLYISFGREMFKATMWHLPDYSNYQEGSWSYWLTFEISRECCLNQPGDKKSFNQNWEPHFARIKMVQWNQLSEGCFILAFTTVIVNNCVKIKLWHPIQIKRPPHLKTSILILNDLCKCLRQRQSWNV